MTDTKALMEKSNISLNKHSELLDAIYKVEPIELYNEIMKKLSEYTNAQYEYTKELMK